MGHKRFAAEESDSDSEDMGPSDHRMSLEETQAERDQREIMRQDLCSRTRDEMTSVDKGSRRPRTNLNQLLAGRECNQEGTEAAKSAARYRMQIHGWHNYKDTTDAKEADFERLDDIAAGQEHRRMTQARLDELKLVRGGALTLDNLEYGGNQPYRPPGSHRAGASTSVRAGRGMTVGGRGGGNAGRATGRSIPSAPRDRPLDPAVDPDRPYGYSGKGRNRGYQETLSQNRVSKAVPQIATAPAGPKRGQMSKRGNHATPRQDRPWPPMALMENPVVPSSSTQDRKVPNYETQTTANAPLPTKRAKPSAKPKSTYIDDLVDEFLKKMKEDPQSSRRQPEAETKDTPGLLAPHKAGTNISVHPAVKVEPAFLDRAGLRPVQDSPSKFTDGVRSNTDCSEVSPVVAVSAHPIGLGISGLDAMDNTQSGQRAADGMSASMPEDLMDISVPGDGADTLIPKSSPSEEMVSIPKSEAEVFKTIMAYLRADDGHGLTQYLTRTKPLLNNLEETTVPTSHAAEVKANVVDQLETLISDRNLPGNLPRRSSAVQTTPSLGLGESKWAAPSPIQYPSFSKGSSKPSEAKTHNDITGDLLETGPIAATTGVKPMIPVMNPFSDTAVVPGTSVSTPLEATTKALPVAEAAKPKLQTQDQLLVGLMYSSARPVPARPVVTTSNPANEDVNMSDADVTEIDNPFAAPFKPANTLGASSTKSSMTSKSGLGGSKFADPAYKPPLNVSSALRPKPSNKSPKKPAASAMSSKPSESIFGDARNISRDPDAVYQASSAMRTYPVVQEKPTAIKRTKAGAGFAQMMIDHEAALALKTASNSGRG